MKWTEERVETLLRLKSEGYQHWQIGDRFGVTERAIASKLAKLRKAEPCRHSWICTGSQVVRSGPYMGTEHTVVCQHCGVERPR